jgi:hypothetical protein
VAQSAGTTGNVGKRRQRLDHDHAEWQQRQDHDRRTVASGLTDVIDNVPTLSVNGQVVIVPGGWLNTCPASVTLPVHLQDFDVK